MHATQGSTRAPLGRARELATLTRAVGRLADGHGIVVTLEGGAGSGKSTLLDALVSIADSSGIAVREAVAIELDRDLQLAVARRLLEPLARTERVAQSASSLAEGGLVQLHRLVAAAAERSRSGPLLLAIDDLQWADAQTLQAVESICGMTRELGLGVALSWRRGELDQRRRQRILALDRVLQIEVHDLSSEWARALVRQALPGADRQFVEACLHVAGGNPFLLRELTTAIAATGEAGTASAADRILDITPATVSTAVLTRIGRMPVRAGALARSVAILGDGAPLHHAMRLAELDDDDAADAADALVAAEILTGTQTLSFRHPLLAAAVLSDIGPFKVARMYRRAAEVVAAAGEIERAGALLLRCDPGGDAMVVELLRRAAARPLWNGDPTVAVRLLERALAEPPPDDQRGPLLIDLARAQASLGQAAALDHLDQALAVIKDRSVRARVLDEIARLHHVRSDFSRAARLAERALSELPDGHGRDRLLATWLMAGGLDPDRSAQTVPVKLELAERALQGAPPDEPDLQATIALHLICTFADPAIVAELATGAVRRYAKERDDGLGLAFGFALAALFYAGRLQALVDACELVFELAHERSSMLIASAAAQWRGQARIELGDIQGALVDADTALLPYRYGWKSTAANAAGIRAVALIELDDPAGARRALDGNPPLPYPPYFHTRGLVELADGSPEPAGIAFREAGRMLETIWEVDSPAVVPWRSGAALAALRTGDHPSADRLSQAELDLARRSGVAIAYGRAARVRGLVVGGAAGIELGREACATLAGSDGVLELLRAELSLGAALRRAGSRREARELLAGVRDRATRLGLTALATRAASEHSASGGRLRRASVDGVAGLTASELRIAHLAAAGHTNREIAAELFLAPKTVEWHLRRIFRKLQISSRRALIPLLSTADGDAPL